MGIREDIEGLIRNGHQLSCDCEEDEICGAMKAEALTTYITDKIEEAKCNRRPEGKCKECIERYVQEREEKVRCNFPKCTMVREAVKELINQALIKDFPCPPFIYCAVVDRDSLGCGVVRDIYSEIDKQVRSVENYGDKERVWVYITTEEWNLKEQK